jgi:hypothetical protein
MLPNKVVTEHQKGQKPTWPIGKPAIPPKKNAPMGNSKHGQVGASAAHEAGESAATERIEKAALRGGPENEAVEEAAVKKAQGKAFAGMR